ncbi:hypothetical protein K458DRAFT_436372 [Lentithecium fluviatile CBS 122367]|uniref:RING-type domain-containing protein n=1 Tax=Lentithecium fluviatile CBS 122367 TaxID=1168545 RepID=A0A6G1IHN7_9PLEO|nr:hypothetical protein K458DRAFT_436372 [Lentithecium fluviatile CBS 122367]
METRSKIAKAGLSSTPRADLEQPPTGLRPPTWRRPSLEHTKPPSGQSNTITPKSTPTSRQSSSRMHTPTRKRTSPEPKTRSRYSAIKSRPSSSSRPKPQKPTARIPVPARRPTVSPKQRAVARKEAQTDPPATTTFTLTAEVVLDHDPPHISIRARPATPEPHAWVQLPSAESITVHGVRYSVGDTVKIKYTSRNRRGKRAEYGFGIIAELRGPWFLVAWLYTKTDMRDILGRPEIPHLPEGKKRMLSSHLDAMPFQSLCAVVPSQEEICMDQWLDVQGKSVVSFRERPAEKHVPVYLTGKIQAAGLQNDGLAHTPDEPVANEEVPDESMFDEETPNEHAAEEETLDEPVSDTEMPEAMSDEEVADEHAAEGDTLDEPVLDREMPDRPILDEETPGEDTATSIVVDFFIAATKMLEELEASGDIWATLESWGHKVDEPPSDWDTPDQTAETADNEGEPATDVGADSTTAIAHLTAADAVTSPAVPILDLSDDAPYSLVHKRCSACDGELNYDKKEVYVADACKAFLCIKCRPEAENYICVKHLSLEHQKTHQILDSECVVCGEVTTDTSLIDTPCGHPVCGTCFVGWCKKELCRSTYWHCPYRCYGPVGCGEVDCEVRDTEGRLVNDGCCWPATRAHFSRSLGHGMEEVDWTLDDDADEVEEVDKDLEAELTEAHAYWMGVLENTV